MDFSIASVMEIQDCLRDGILRKHFTGDETQKAQSLTVRSLQVSKGLKRYLQSCRRHPGRATNDHGGRRTSNDRHSSRTTNDND